MIRKKIALIGNPNCGKSTLFNLLTGLNQRTGNFSGVTVDKYTGTMSAQGIEFEITDYPGTYSLHPLTTDEHVVLRALVNSSESEEPEAIIYVASATDLEKHLLLYSQVRDLGYPMILAISMMDLAREKGIHIDVAQLEKKLGHPVLGYSSRQRESIQALRDSLTHLNFETPQTGSFYQIPQEASNAIAGVPVDRGPYAQLLRAYYQEEWPHTNEPTRPVSLDDDDKLRWQVNETLERYEKIERELSDCFSDKPDYLQSKSYRADRWLTHHLWGPLAFMLVMFLVFQAIFSLAEWPMNGIDGLFAWMAESGSQLLPDAWWADLIVEGLIPGIAGVVIFIPQIALLFFLIGLLEESGYMSRAIFLFDKLFRKVGLHGRSLVALVSASACAIPAVMSARSIKNEKERLITILVSPFMSCSARTPVYIVLIAFIVSSERIFGWINPQGLVFVGFYLVGLITALVVAWLLKKAFATQSDGFLMLEMPEYKWPNLQTVLWHTWHKVKSFILEAGKIILVISIVLWFLASYGPTDRNEEVAQTLSELKEDGGWDTEDLGQVEQSLMLEHSYAGHLGKAIEPVIKPLGFDWKIGIALITSFAAREVFVSTMATIYSVESEEDYEGIQKQMEKERHLDTLEPVYTQSTALSLVVFYIFAMQCMSTLAVVKKETGGWKWPIIQFIGMTAIAYIGAWLVQLLW